jgi:V-type H+-transporting ATPase subunit a
MCFILPRVVLLADPHSSTSIVYFEELEVALKQLNANDALLSKEYYHYVEMKEVLEKNKIFLADQAKSTEPIIREEIVLTEGGATATSSGRGLPDLEAQGSSSGGGETDTAGIGFISGVILKEKFESFERVVFRSTRGNVLVRSADITRPIIDPQSNAEVSKMVFVVFFHGGAIRARLQKICEAMGANVYSCPRQTLQWEAKYSEVNTKLSELKTIVLHTNENKRQALRSAAGQIKAWRDLLLKEKATYHVMNMFRQDQVRRCLMAEGWCPTDATERIQEELRAASEARGEQVPSILREKATREEPPTYFRTNKFTSAFQAIVDAYGMAKYQEVNPAPFAMATFPFLFAVMFGDVGHGVLLTVYASYLLHKEKVWGKGKHLPEMIRMTYNGRYMLIIMGIMSIYTGILYNELFSVPMYIFDSKFKFGEQEGSLWMAKPVGSTYPIGADPIWHGLPNELTYSNSLKMKMSIIFGVLQMVLGVVLSLLNHLYFNDMRSVWCEFVPQMLYLCGIFGYLVVMIFVKWSIDWNAIARPAPSLTNMLISMFLAPGQVAPDDTLYWGQAYLQLFLVFIAVISIPWMLLAKPYLLKREHKRHTADPSFTSLLHSDETRNLTAATPEGSEAGGAAGGAGDHSTLEAAARGAAAASSASGHGGGGHGGHGEEFDFGEIFVHQVIHTIEFVLGGVSHTASYLRLWALSLAHAQLSAVFWDKVMGITIGMGNPVIAFVGYGAWAGATVGVLMCMESLSAFLHALRLHWVEFQSKFYKSDGKKFTPFSFAMIIEEADNEGME